MSGGTAAAWVGTLLLASVAAASPAEDGGDRPAAKPDVRLEATLRSDLFQPSRSDDLSRTTQVTTLQVQALPRWGEALDAQVKLRAKASNEPRQTREALPTVVEAYVTMRYRDADLSVGKQLVIWGRADGINPTDNITPRDTLTWLPWDSDQRFGVWGLRYNQYFDAGLSLSAFYTPLFSSSLLPKPVLPNPVLSPRPPRNAANSVVALKLDRSGAEVDWSVSHYRGLSLLPDARILGSNALGPLLAYHHDRVDIWGADLAARMGHFVLRSELAWTQPGNSDDGAAAVKKPSLFGIVGIERALDDSLSINGQWFLRRIRSYANPYALVDPGQRFLAVQNAITDGQQDRLSQGGSLRIAKKWLGESLQGELLISYNRTRKDYLARPTLSYAFDDSTQATIGAYYFDGRDDSFFGRKRADRRLFAEIRYSF